MKRPALPPATTEILLSSLPPIKLAAIRRRTSEDQSYLHWDDLRHREPPEGCSHEEWWAALKLFRYARSSRTPLGDTTGRPFTYTILDRMSLVLHQVDLGAGGNIEMPAPILNPELRDRYCVSSLVEEAVTSSQIEGATTTRLVAKEMLRSGRPPRDASERMILNNYHAIQHIRSVKDQPLSKELVFEIHRIMTEGTLKRDDAAGRFRNDLDDEKVEVVDSYGNILHEPPPSDTLEERMRLMCEFANQRGTKSFIHPVVRSIILHFWLAYDHPFVDGNGRTARALFYWSMLRHGYWLFEFISISTVINKARTKYGRAFLLTETDENDLTYFVDYHLELIQKALHELYVYIRRKTAETQMVEKKLHGMSILNHRQQALVAHAIRHPDQTYTIESHRRSHNVVYQTARTDLLDLAQKGLLLLTKVKRLQTFKPAPDLEQRLTKLARHS